METMDRRFDGDLLHFRAIIEKYEALFVELNHELQSVKTEHNSVKLNLSTLIKENQELSKQLIKRESPNPGKSLDNEDLLECFKKQIESLQLEKAYISELWQNATKSVELLENELRIFQCGSDSVVPKKELLKVSQSYEDRLRDLTHELKVAEKKLDDLSKIQHKPDLSNSTKNCMNLTFENQAGALKIVKNLEDEVLLLQKRLQDSERTVMKLQKTLNDKDVATINMTETNKQYREKVAEALEVVQAALNEKDAALIRETEAKDEIEKVSQELSNIAKETEDKIKNEISKAKIEFISKQENFKLEMQRLENEVSMRILENEKISMKCSLLESELERFRKGNVTMDEFHTSKLLVLEKNLESTFQKLLLSEKNNIQLAAEKETIKNDMSQMAEHYERVLKTKDIEKLTFENRIKQFQNDLEETKDSLRNIREQLVTEKDEKLIREKEWKEQMEEQERSLAKSFTDKLTETSASFKETITNLKMQLNSKDQINKKWSIETKTIVQSLENLVATLKKDLSKTKKENKRLRSELFGERKKFEQYKHFLELITNDVDKISKMVPENVNL